MQSEVIEKTGIHRNNFSKYIARHNIIAMLFVISLTPEVKASLSSKERNCVDWNSMQLNIQKNIYNNIITYLSSINMRRNIPNMRKLQIKSALWPIIAISFRIKAINAETVIKTTNQYYIINTISYAFGVKPLKQTLLFLRDAHR